MATFVLSDENLTNSYGFKVSTKGIDLKRFKSNPVMLAEHFNSIGNLLGRWKNVKKTDDGRLTAEDEFDLDDEDAKRVQGKVERGFLKGVSIGITFDRENMKQQPDGSFLLTKCELMEASICAVPSNAGALKLYAGGRLMDADEVKLSLNDISNNFKIQKTDMKKVILSLTALMALDLQKMNTAEGVDVDAVNAGIEKLKADLDKAAGTVQTLKTANEQLTGQLAVVHKAKVDSLVNDAITAGKLNATEKESWIQLATSNYELAEKTLKGIPAKGSLSAAVVNASNPGEVKTIDDFVKLPLAQQLAFKAENPEAYKALF